MKRTLVVEVKRSASDVFAWLTRPEHASQWLEGVSNVTPLKPLEEAGWERGAKLTFQYAKGKKTHQLTGIITVCEEAKRFGVKVLDAPGRFEGLIELADLSDGKTQIAVTIVAATGNIVAGMLYAFFPKSSDLKHQAVLVKALERLKTALQ